VKDLNPKTKTLMKEIEEDTKKWKDILCSWIGRTNIVKIMLNAIYRFSAIPTKIPIVFSTELEQKYIKICMEPQKCPRYQNNLEKEKQSQRYCNSRLQVILQSCSNLNSMVLAQK